MNTHTFRRLAASVALGAGIAATVLSAPDAHADSSDFLDQIHELGFFNATGGDVALLSQGYGVCRALADGVPGPQVGVYVYTHTDASVGAEDAVNFVVVAVETLCPQFDHRGDTA
jgi:hypothetical protein